MPGERTVESPKLVEDLSRMAALKPPLISEVAGFLGSPQELVRLCALPSKGIAEWCRVVHLPHWKRLYTERWPAFQAFFEYCTPKDAKRDWRALYQETLAGKSSCMLEVFDREKKLGFAMSCMPAQIRWEATLNGYVVNYLSASQVMPEFIPIAEERRLRFCPGSVQTSLRPDHCHQGKHPPVTQLEDLEAHGEHRYPFKVLEGIQDLRKGQGVELQWRMQLGSPFGWWFGTLEALDRHDDGRTATATLVFTHFPADSRWYRLNVTFGDGSTRRCAIGGYSGGLRGANEADQRTWMRFFPREPVVF